MPPPAISKQPSIKPRRSSGVHGAIDKSAVPGESVEELKRRVAVLEQEKEKEERARNHAELEKVKVTIILIHYPNYECASSLFTVSNIACLCYHP